jgi:hypothetical protein
MNNRIPETIMPNDQIKTELTRLHLKAKGENAYFQILLLDWNKNNMPGCSVTASITKRKINITVNRHIPNNFGWHFLVVDL